MRRRVESDNPPFPRPSLRSMLPAPQIGEIMTHPDPLRPERDAALTAALRDALAAAAPDYTPRTRYLLPDGQPKFLNRLMLQPSPYLQQHAHNPVDWRPWSDEALAEAKARDVPLFISVGYATCHWCHVMEEGSFDDEEVAAVLNRDFVAVKIDREERPDLDQIFMLTTQIQTQHGGWPNSIWATAEGRPFHSGTYFPKPQFLQTLAAVTEAWRSKRVDLITLSERLAGMITEHLTAQQAAAPIDAAVHAGAMGWLKQAHNQAEGGFSNGTQFPQEVFLLYLLDRWRRTGDLEALTIAARSLHGIAAGGIHDHAGGGFHRYAVDVNWRTPHFEKMLYNQARLARAFVEAWESLGDAAFERAARRCFDYVLRDMTAPDGAFYAAEDADSARPDGEMEEGWFYCWPADALKDALGDDAEAASRALGLFKAATIEAGPIAHLEPGQTVDAATLDPLLERMRVAREVRPRPLRDDKVIAEWNGMMIHALAIGGAALEEPRYIAAASRAAEAIWTALWREDGGLARLHLGGRVSGAGMSPDYAQLGLGYVALWDATGEARWLDRAQTLADEMIARFGDDVGRLRLTEADGPLGPVYDNEDGATPSGESTALEFFALLAHRTDAPEAQLRADRLLSAISGRIAPQPIGKLEALRAAEIATGGESDLRRSLSGGRARLRVRRDGGQVRLSLAIADGWHATGQDAAEGLAAATLNADGAELVKVDWPEGAEITGDATIAAELSSDHKPALLTLSLQFCSGEVCHAPEEAQIRV